MVAVVILTFLKAHWRATVILTIMLILALGGVRWCRKPSPPPLPPVSETTAPARAKVDAKADVLRQAQATKQAQKITALEAEVAKLRNVAAREARQPLDAAQKGGGEALAKLASLWFAPGELDRLLALSQPR
jgi:hypothetical protein